MGELGRGPGRRERRGPSPTLRLYHLTAVLGAVHEHVVLLARPDGGCGGCLNLEQAEGSNRSRCMRLISTTEGVVLQGPLRSSPSARAWQIAVPTPSYTCNVCFWRRSNHQTALNHSRKSAVEPSQEKRSSIAEACSAPYTLRMIFRGESLLVCWGFFLQLRHFPRIVGDKGSKDGVP